MPSSAVSGQWQGTQHLWWKEKWRAAKHLAVCFGTSLIPAGDRPVWMTPWTRYLQRWASIISALLRISPDSDIYCDPFFLSQLAKIQLYSFLIWHLGFWIFCGFLGLHLSPYWNLSSQILIAELPVTCLSKTQWKDYKSPATRSTFSCRNIWVLFILCKNWGWNLLNLAAGNVYFDLTVLQDGPRKPMRPFLPKVPSIGTRDPFVSVLAPWYPCSHKPIETVKWPEDLASSFPSPQ